MIPNLTSQEAALHDKVYDEAWGLIRGELHLQNRVRSDQIDLQTRERLTKAITLFHQTLQLHPKNWGSMFALGKIYQRLNDYAAAVSWFKQAHQVEPHNIDILREGSLSAMSLGDGGAAVDFATAAHELNPENAGLTSNLALALLVDGKVESAKKHAVSAVQSSPNDQISRSVLQLIENVVTGKTPRPRTLS